MEKVPDPFRPEFWKAYQDSFRTPEDEEFLKPDFWDRMADTYDELEKQSFYRDMVESVVAEMRRVGALAPEFTLLDVCCGTGTYTVRFAPRVRRVVALDISPGMLTVLRGKLREAGIENVEVVEADWRRWTFSGTFDTVFVSLTPILNDLREVDRLLTLTRRFLVLVHWAGLRENELFSEVLERFFGRRPRRRSPGAVVLFNYLFSRGFPADIRFFSGLWERNRPLEKELERLLWKLRGEGLSVDEKLREDLRTFLENRARGGRVSSRTRVRIALVLADLRKEPLAFARGSATN